MYRKYNFVIMLMALKRENGKGITGTYVLYDFYNFSERKIMVYGYTVKSSGCQEAHHP